MNSASSQIEFVVTESESIDYASMLTPEQLSLIAGGQCITNSI